jgi:hypothetical protein
MRIADVCVKGMWAQFFALPIGVVGCEISYVFLSTLRKNLVKGFVTVTNMNSEPHFFLDKLKEPLTGFRQFMLA